MDFKLVKKDAFRVVGMTENICRDMEKNFAIVPAMWEKAHKEGLIDKLCAVMSAEPQAILGMSLCDAAQWKYAIAVASTAPAGDFDEIVVPAATWAVFRGEGTNISIQELEKRVLTEWFPTSGFEYAEAPEIEVYYSPDPHNAVFELWVPVLPKK